jgi:hypothetical protein
MPTGMQQDRITRVHMQSKQRLLEILQPFAGYVVKAAG